MQRRGTTDFRADRILAVGIILLWSFGRILNPIRHFVAQSGDSIGYQLGFFEVVYVLAHCVLFVYSILLVVRFFKRNGSSLRWETLGELAMYIYVLATLLLSLYFIGYEFGYLPPFLEGFMQAFFSASS